MQRHVEKVSNRSATVEDLAGVFLAPVSPSRLVRVESFRKSVRLRPAFAIGQERRDALKEADIVRPEEFQRLHRFAQFMRIDLGQQFAEGPPGIAESPGLLFCGSLSLTEQLLAFPGRADGWRYVQPP